MSQVFERPEVAGVRLGDELDWDSLAAYLRQNLPGLHGDFSVQQFPNGSANLTYLVRFGDQPLVVRRPPFGVIATAAHDMRREHKVLSRLHAAYPRAPLGLLYCADESVIGAHFLVSEYRSGVVVWDHVPQVLDVGSDAGRRIGLAVVDALADLHLVDAAACGLGDLGRPDGYLERQVRGWQGRWEAVALEGRGTLDRVGERLAQHRPESGQPALVHNDFKVDNCQFAPGAPEVVTSVFDWDMATLGDPLTDLGTLLNYWPDGPTPADAVPGLERLCLPTRDEVVARYALRSGQTLIRSDVAWYEAFGCWKTAIILQQLYVRHLRGESADDRQAARGEQVLRIADRALALAETLG
ncbi:MAG TPA: phosphotransferase family protein [Nocardioidaceae bacterium]|nr:phosphotransferase family protein [Nocardioidaceae bacterium]